jgi:hypothetical protein
MLPEANSVAQTPITRERYAGFRLSSTAVWWTCCRATPSRSRIASSGYRPESAAQGRRKISRADPAAYRGAGIPACAEYVAYPWPEIKWIDNSAGTELTAK